MEGDSPNVSDAPPIITQTAADSTTDIPAETDYPTSTEMPFDPNTVANWEGDTSRPNEALGLDLEDFSLGKYKLGLTEDEFLRQLGQPPIERFDTEQDGYVVRTIVFDEGTAYLFAGDDVPGFFLSGLVTDKPALTTRRGLKIGDPVETVIALYGLPGYITDNVWHYYDAAGDYQYHHFTVKGGVLMQIYLFLVM
jgi:hypothetical protein